MSSPVFEQLVDDLLVRWPGVTDGWPEGALRKIAGKSAGLSPVSVRLAVERLGARMAKLGKFSPAPNDVLWYLEEYGEPASRMLPAPSGGPAVPWSEASQELFGEVRSLASVVGEPTEEGDLR